MYTYAHVAAVTRVIPVNIENGEFSSKSKLLDHGKDAQELYYIQFKWAIKIFFSQWIRIEVVIFCKTFGETRLSSARVRDFAKYLPIEIFLQRLTSALISAGVPLCADIWRTNDLGAILATSTNLEANIPRTIFQFVREDYVYAHDNVVESPRYLNDLNWQRRGGKGAEAESREQQSSRYPAGIDITWR